MGNDEEKNDEIWRKAKVGKRSNSITLVIVKADSHIACRAHAVTLPCRAAKGLECVFPI